MKEEEKKEEKLKGVLLHKENERETKEKPNERIQER